MRGSTWPTSRFGGRDAGVTSSVGQLESGEIRKPVRIWISGVGVSSAVIGNNFVGQRGEECLSGGYSTVICPRFFHGHERECGEMPRFNRSHLSPGRVEQRGENEQEGKETRPLMNRLYIRVASKMNWSVALLPLSVDHQTLDRDCALAMDITGRSNRMTPNFCVIRWRPYGQAQ
jgi:hypothetical protein